jgi:hypothetical protein
MKRTLLTAITAMALTLAGHAQTQKDWYIIGSNIGNIGIDFQKDNTAFSFAVNPRVAWFVKDNLAVGAEVQIGLNTAKGFTQVNYGIGPVARYYLQDKGLQPIKRTRWFLDGNVGFQGTNTKVAENPGVSTNGLGVGFGAGIAYFVNQNIALEVLPKYNLTVGFGNSTTNNAIDISVGFQIHLPKARLRALKNDVK